jgi:hypothetical protein
MQSRAVAATLLAGLFSYRIENIGSLNSSALNATFDGMRSERPTDSLVPPGLLAELQAAAYEEHREPRGLVREALIRYLEQRTRAGANRPRRSARRRQSPRASLSFAKAISCRRG